MANVSVNILKLKENGKDIMMLSNELNEALNDLFNKLENISSTAWTGDSAKEYQKRINKEKSEYIELKNNLYKYGKIISDFSDQMDSEINRCNIYE